MKKNLAVILLISSFVLPGKSSQATVTNYLTFNPSSHLKGNYWQNSASLLTQSVPDLEKGMTYEEARNMLIEGGWQPIFNEMQVDNPRKPATIEYLINEKGYTELVDCSGTGEGLCLFRFTNDLGQVISIATGNNQPGDESKVYSWRIEEQPK